MSHSGNQDSASLGKGDPRGDHSDSWADVDEALTLDSAEAGPAVSPGGDNLTDQGDVGGMQNLSSRGTPPLALVETAFLASTSSLLWLVSYYLSIGPWMRIVFPIPIALAYLRWSQRASWMTSVVAGLLLAILMGPYLSLMFFVPYGFLGVQLGAAWKRRASWGWSIGLGTLIATISFFFRIWLISIFLGEDLWAYLTGRITSFIDWLLAMAVDWGVLGLDALGQVDPTTIQLATIAMIICSDVVYLFTIHVAAWLLLDRLGSPIPAPPKWVRVLLDDTGAS